MKSNFSEAIDQGYIDGLNVTFLRRFSSYLSGRFEDVSVIVSPTTDYRCFNIDVDLNINNSWIFKSDDMYSFVNYIKLAIYDAYDEVRFRLRRFNSSYKPEEISAVIDVKFKHCSYFPSWVVQVFQTENGKFKIIGCQRG